MKKIMSALALLLPVSLFLIYLLTGNIGGYEFNSLFPDQSISVGSEGKALSGKTIVCIGDSIFGIVRNSTSVTSFLAQETGATVYNAGFGGTRMSTHTKDGYKAFSMWALADSIVSQDWLFQESQAANGSDYFEEQLKVLKDIDFSDVDILVIHFGTNDFTANPGIMLDNSSDPYDCTTLSGALRYSIEKIQKAYPQLGIYISLPLYRYWQDTDEYPETYKNSLGKYYSEYIEVIKQTSLEYELPIIDGSAGMSMDQETVCQLTLDGVHLNRTGRQRFAKVIAEYLLETYLIQGEEDSPCL